jgi:hypothetical protein
MTAFTLFNVLPPHLISKEVEASRKASSTAAVVASALLPEVKFVPFTIQTALAAGEATALNANALATVTIKSLTLGIAM